MRNATLRTKIALAFLGLIVLAGLPGLYSVRVFQQAIDGLQNLREGNLEAIRLVRQVSAALDVCQSKEIKLRVLRAPAALEGLDLQAQKGREALESLRRNRAVRAVPDLAAVVHDLSEDWDTYVSSFSAEAAMVRSARWRALDEFAAERVIPLGSSIAGRVRLLRDEFDEAAGALSVELESRSRRTAQFNGMLLFLGLVVALVLTPFLSERMARPLRRLKIRALRMSKGDFGDDVPVESEDEIGKLTRAFNYMQTQLKELDRQKSEFISVAAHELRNPISVLTGYASMMRGGQLGEIPESLKKPVEVVHRESEHLLKLVEVFLDLAKLDSGEFRLQRTEIDPVRFAKDALDAYAGAMGGRSIRLTHDIPPNLPAVFWDADRLREVLDNLMSNALKFTPENGRIHLKVFRCEGGIGFSVSDTGPGIPPDKIGFVFDKFYQVDRQETRKTKGMGLGLALAKGLVVAHGGTIGVTSETGNGATFTVILPLGEKAEGTSKS